MPRRANPDPIEVEHIDESGVKRTIRATRRGTYEILRDGVVKAWAADPLSGFGMNRYASNRRQAEAIEAAKDRIKYPRAGDEL